MKIFFYFLSIILLLPLIFLIVTSFGFDLNMLQHIIETTLFDQTKNTLLLMGNVFLFSSLISIPLAYFYSQYDFKYKKILEFFLILPLAFPTFILASIFVEQSFPITNIIGFSLVCALSLYPYVFLTVKNAMSNVSQIYNDIATVNGLSSVQTFLKILLPASLPAIFGGTLLVMMETVGDYATSIITGVPILTTGIYLQWFNFHNPVVASQMALFLLSMFFILTYLFQRIKFNIYNPSGNNIFKHLGKPNIYLKSLIYMLTFIVIFFGFIYPIFNLMNWTYISFSEIDFSILFNDTFNSVLVALLSILSCFSITICLLYVYRFCKENKYDVFITSFLRLIYGIPGIIIGMSILSVISFFYGIPFLKIIFDSIFVLIFAYAIKYYSLMFINCQNSITQVPKDIDNVCSVFGFSKLKTFIKLFPSFKTSIYIGVILILIDIFRELTMILMIQPKNFTTLSTQIFDYSRSEMIYMMGSWSLILIFILSILVFLLHKFIKSDTIIS